VDRCEERLHAVVMAAGSQHELTLVSWISDAPAHLELRDWNGEVLGSMEGVEPGAVVPLDAQWAGEHALVVRSEDGSVADYTLAVQCVEGCEAPTTRYPIVFLHGMAGTESFFDLLDYWYDVIPTLTDAGFNVHVASVDPFQPTPVRATQWMGHLDELFATGQARRVNLIGHSQGGLDSRYLASVLDTEGRIRSITTVATPHRGAAAADLVNGLVEGSGITQAIADSVFDALIGLYGLDTDQDIIAQMTQLTSEASAQFNIDVPDRADVAYYSWAGVTCDLIDVVCQATHGAEIVDPLLAATHVVTSLLEGDNDGLVSVESSKWGTYLGALDADHLDEVGLLPGTTAPGFDHLEFYRSEAERLADEGF
jgi:triacylglycerol esterase/lipase EstA (alpha/beta hydrolase family)